MAPPDNAIRTDSAGVLLVEYPRLPPIEASRIAIAAEPDLVLGEGNAFAGPDYEFFRIRGVSQLRDGTLVVANQGSHELRFYGADGRFLQSAGREGEGPGEFQRMADLWITAGDALVVWDQRSLRLQPFTPDGAFVRATSMSKSSSVEFPWTPSPQTVLENGRVAAFFRSRPRPTNDDPANGIPERPPLLVALYRIGAEIQLVLEGALPAYEAELRRFVLAGVGRVLLPAIRDVFVDADERTWVERYDVPRSGPSRCEVFARDGTWIGRVEMPEGLDS